MLEEGADDKNDLGSLKVEVCAPHGRDLKANRSKNECGLKRAGQCRDSAASDLHVNGSYEENWELELLPSSTAKFVQTAS